MRVQLTFVVERLRGTRAQRRAFAWRLPFAPEALHDWDCSLT